MKQYQIAPSILSANFARLGEEIRSVLSAGADIIHFDVMDNHYVPNLTIGSLVCQSLRDDGIESFIDVHLMCKPVDALIEQFARAGANMITFHPEASDHVDRSLDLIHSLGCKAGLALNPATSLETLDFVMNKLDIILQMTVNPGFGGQAFIPAMLPKISQIRQRINDSGRDILLEVDGGVNLKTLPDVISAGADVFVMGSAIFNSDNYEDVISKAKSLFPNTN